MTGPNQIEIYQAELTGLMRFFTPELLVRLNSPDDSVAAAAESEWDAALAQYDQQLAADLAKAPNAVRELGNLCLHDAELLLYHPGTFHPRIAALLLKTEDQERVSLLFELTAPPQLDRAAAKTAGERLFWLYEELRCQPNTADRYELRILLSDHSILMLSFAAVSIIRYQEGKHSLLGEELTAR